MFEDQNYQLIRLGDILKQNTTVTKVDCPDKETFVTLSSKGRGAKKREIKDGKTPVAFSGYRIHAGQFIYSRIDARNAAFDIVPECLEGAVVSKDFPVFDFDTNAIEPVYLLHSVLQNSFIEQIQSSSFGATNRQRIKEETMMNYSIVLPPLSKQREYSQFVQLTIIIKKHYQQLMDSFDILVKSRFIEMFSACNKAPLTELADITMGQSPDSSAYNDQGIGVPFYQGKTEFTDTFVTVNKYCSKPKKMAKEMDILMSVRAPVGAVNLTSQACCIGRGLAAITPKKDRTDVLFLFNALKTMEQQISDMGVGSTFTAISKDDLMKIKIPVAPVSLQNQFSSFVKQVDKSKFVETIEPDHPAVFQNIHGFPSFGLIST